MKIFSISDLHLSGMSDKPMDVFGSGWENHFEKIKTDWQNKVSDEDIVLIAGDISWGTTLDEGLYDLNSLKDLKGKKEITRTYIHLYTPRGVDYANAVMPSNPDSAGEKFFFKKNNIKEKFP